MLSLNNGFNMNDIDDFIKRTCKFLNINSDNIEFVCEPKIDGYLYPYYMKMVN